MQVIPVLDLLDSCVVRAVRGERSRYRPIESSLCAGSDALAVARALIAASGSRTLYVADLAAILGRGDHAPLLAALCCALGDDAPGAQIWLDGGYADYASMRALFERIDAHLGDAPRSRCATLVPVFGTETLADANALKHAEAAGMAPILSLDYRAGRLLASAALAGDAPAWWPERVIAMTLDHVGSYDGPDLDTFARIRALAGGRTVIGAGGIRHRGDLAAAEASGAAGWLVASALHDRRIEPAMPD